MGASTIGEDRIAGAIRKAMAEVAPAVRVSGSDSLRAAGLSSLDIVNLVLAIEAELGLEFAEEEITPENFGSVDSITKFIAAREDLGV